MFCYVCSDMLTCLFCIMFDYFSNDKNHKKIRLIIIVDTIIANKKQFQPSRNPPRYFWFIHYISLFIFSLPFLPYLSPIPPLIGFCDATGAFTDQWVDSILIYAQQLTTLYVLSRQYTLASQYNQSSPNLHLTSTSICSLCPFVTRWSPFPADV